VGLNHAAILSVSGPPDRSLLKRYYEQYLTYRPENPRALYGLADVAVKEGQTEIAKQYAKRCHQALLQTEDETARKDLLDVVLERWPELSE
jgi:Tfp pilus assembly protein PilF